MYNAGEVRDNYYHDTFRGGHVISSLVVRAVRRQTAPILSMTHIFSSTTGYKRKEKGTWQKTGVNTTSP